MILAAATIALAYAIGSVPVAYLTARVARGVDIREVGSGNTGASNIWQSVSKTLVVPVGLAQIAQGLAGPLIARLTDQPDTVQGAAAIAAVLANDWNPWLRFSGGRGVGQTVGAMLALSPPALAVFIAVSLLGVAARAVPQSVALALLASPSAAAVAGASGATVAALAFLAVIALIKRVLANGRPGPGEHVRQVLANRLLLDRDIRDRDAWVRRGRATADPAARRDASAP